MIPVKSSTIQARGYDKENKILYIQFNSGTIYYYEDISEEEYKSLIEDQSIGSKLRRIVKDKLYKKLDATDEVYKRLKY